MPPYGDPHLGDNPAAMSAADDGNSPASAAGHHLAGGPTWLNSSILRHQPHQFVDGSFLHLQTASFRGEDDVVAASSDSMIAAAGEGETPSAVVGGGGQHQQAVEGTWQSARCKAEILAHPLYEQLLSAHVACLRIATPVDQLPRIDAQLAQSQSVVAKYSVLGGQMLAGDHKELDQFME